MKQVKLEYKKEYCSTCNAIHSKLDGGDIIDCMIYYRNHLEPKERKEARESKVEVWNGKEWIKANNRHL